MATATATSTRRPRTEQQQAETREARTAELAALKKTFDEKVTTLRNSDQWKNMLTTMAHFHRYSFQNMLLIWAQNPEATHCTGYATWKKLGYQVRKSEKGIRILAPYTYTRTDANGEPLTDENGQDVKGVGFRPVSTFDRSQVEPGENARPLDDETVQILHGNDEHGIILSLGDALRAAGWNLTFEPIKSDANGYTDPKTRRIVVDSEIPAAQQAKTLIHEAAHALLHADLKTGQYVQHRGLYETEAESAAYVVAAALGWDTAAYSVGYVTGWSEGEAETLQAAGANVLKAAHTILEWVEANPR